ncbi:hypothetical protein C2S52_023674 [Perilla frutescens var. hirtella]|nr:hypothetical protein C2S52_023674 [Perilla frutescens var. hirtella]KAH6815315.1 hypothetical protein C2S51_020135 [Perilla frutescens var. frutescens]
MAESGKAGVSSGNSKELLAGDEDGERSVASVEDQQFWQHGAGPDSQYSQDVLHT